MGAQAALSGVLFILPWMEAERRLYPPFYALPCDWILPYQRVFSPLDFPVLVLAFGPLKLKSDIFGLHQAATLQILKKQNWKPLFSLKGYFVLKELVIETTNPPKTKTTRSGFIRHQGSKA